ncbi:MAG TPA: two-component regulator propeller domain-containing protein [Chitinophagales bacterium]|nr:two-component regulator propeller domain-containing protein [Chitinophagales bacterium]
MKSKPLLLFSFFLFASGFAVSQQKIPVEKLPFKLVSIDDGLSQGLVSALIQDKAGFLWFGTKDGLNKYDGYNFKIYRHVPNDSATLADNYVTRLFQDSRGLIWIAYNSNKIDVFNPKTEFVFHLPLPYNASWEFLPVSGDLITEDKEGNMLINAATEIIKLQMGSAPNKESKFPYTINTVDLQSYFENYGCHLKYGLHFFISSNNNLWISSLDSVFVFANSSLPQQNEVKRFGINYFSFNKSAKWLQENGVASLAEDKRNHLLLVTDFGFLSVFDMNTLELKDSIQFGNADEFNLRAICFDRKGRTWMVLNSQLLLYDYKSRSIKSVNTQNTNFPFDIQQSSYSILEDSSGVIWIGTKGWGVLKYNATIERFKQFTGKSGEIFSTRNMVPDSSGNVILNLGFFEYWKYNSSTGELKDSFLRKEIIGPLLKEYEINANDRAVFNVDHQGNYWFNYNLRNLIKYDPVNQTAEKSMLPPDRFHTEVSSLFFDRQNKMWFISWQEVPKPILFSFDPNSQSISFQDTFPVKGSYIGYPFTSSVIVDDENNFWMATTKGLFAFNPQKKTWQRYTHVEGDTATLSADVLFSLCRDPVQPNKILWVGSNGGGLIRFNKETHRCSTFNTNNSKLPNDVIYGILSDKEGNLWVSTNKGIARFNPQTKETKSFTVNDGLQSNEFNRYAFCKLSTGELAFGGVNGFNVFKPEDVSENKFQPNVVLTGFSINNDEVNLRRAESPLTELIYSASEVDLNYKQNILSFSFTSTDFAAPEKILYQYKMDGVNPGWSPPSNKHEINYTNLDPGSYTLHVRATNSDGNWSRNEATLEISISPPWWNTTLAKITYVAAFILLVFLFIELRIRGLRRQRKILETKVELRTRELKKTQQQLIQSEKMSSLGQLTAGIAHEINNPINFVSANVQPLKRNLFEMKILMERYEGVIFNSDKREELEKLKQQFEKDFTIEESEKLLKGIEEGSKRTADIVRGLRNFSRVDEEEIKKANINEGIEATLLLLQNEQKHRNIEVIKSLAKIPEIDCYPGHINQVFMNLLTNAMDAIGTDAPQMMGERKIFITTFSENNHIKISIRDTGKGMTDEVKQKIFDPFFTTKEVGKGTGLGLSISYGIIEKHNGKIEVKSEIGKGTEFIIFLPA